MALLDTPNDLYQGQPGTTDTLLYTAPAAGVSAVRNIHVANTTGTAATITIGLNAGGALAAANHFMSAVSIPANGTYDWSGFKIINASGTIRGLQGTASALTVSIDGVESS